MKIAVIGSGSFGTAISQSLATQVENVFLFAKRQNVIDDINNNSLNREYFTNIKLESNIKALSFDCIDKISEVDIVILAVPSGVTREVAYNLKELLKDKYIISTAKGLEYPSLKTMTEVIKEETNSETVFSFSGPTFADELIAGNLSAATLGCKDEKFFYDYKKIIPQNILLDYSFDTKSVELCGVLKNIYAIATGIWDSIHTSNNEHFMFLNLCFKEMNMILEKISYDSMLITKFCCFGDFNLTSNVDKSRNRTLGLMIGKNIISISSISSNIVLEGTKSIKGINQMVKDLEINTPIINFVNEVLGDNSNINISILNLLNKIKDLDAKNSTKGREYAKLSTI